MRRDKKPIGRWFGEAILIFFSVFGAFYFDNLRDESNQDDLYLRYLVDFRSDLIKNQQKFAFELSPEFNQNTNEGYLNNILSNYALLDTLLKVPSRKNGDSLANLIDNDIIRGVSKWIFTSKQYEKLSSDYYSFIVNDDLRGKLDAHFRDGLSRHHHKDAINEDVLRFEQNIEDHLNFTTYRTPENRAIIFGNQCINMIDRLENEFINLKNFTQTSKSNDSLLIIEIETELKEWGVEY
jgi:hypothetical protein